MTMHDPPDVPSVSWLLQLTEWRVITERSADRRQHSRHLWANRAVPSLYIVERGCCLGQLSESRQLSIYGPIFLSFCSATCPAQQAVVLLEKVGHLRVLTPIQAVRVSRLSGTMWFSEFPKSERWAALVKQFPHLGG